MDDKTGKLEATEYIAVALEEDGKMLGDLMMPAEALEGLSQEEITRQVFAAHKRLRVADQMLNRQRIKEDAMATGPELMKSLAQVVAGLIALDVWKTWTERAQQDAEELVYLERLARDLDAAATAVHETAKTFEEPLLQMWQEGSESEDLTAWLWQHLIANAISELEEEHGTGVIQSMADERFDALLHKQLFEAQDFKAAVANLLGLYAQTFALDPFSASLFVFCNRRRDKLKILRWDHNGFWLYYRRLESGRFKWPEEPHGQPLMVTRRQLQWLLDGLALQQHQAHAAVSARVVI